MSPAALVSRSSPSVSTLTLVGRLTLFLDFWKTLTRDPFILSTVRGFKIPFDFKPIKSQRVDQIKCSLKDKLAIGNEIKSYLEKGIISKTNHCTGEYISQIFPRDKKSGGIRIILNLSKLNENVKYEHFKMESLGHVINLIEPNCFMGSIDLTDAYYTVSIHPDHRKYLKFVWNHVLYQFNCLPNGLSCAPRVFTKLLKPIFDF